MCVLGPLFFRSSLYQLVLTRSRCPQLPKANNFLAYLALLAGQIDFLATPPLLAFWPRRPFLLLDIWPFWPFFGHAAPVDTCALPLHLLAERWRASPARAAAPPHATSMLAWLAAN
jgi:hypothetical protein